MGGLFLFALYILCTSSGLIFLKLGSNAAASFSIKHEVLSVNLHLFVILGVLFYGISFLLYIYLVSKHSLTFLYPLSTGLVYIVILVSSHFIFKEKVEVVTIVGGILIVLGVMLLNMKKNV